MSEFKLSLNKRDAQGKNKVDKLRADGQTPGVIYSKGEEAIVVKGLAKDLLKAYEVNGMSNILSVDVDGDTFNVLFKEVQMHPFKNQMTHFDLYKVDMHEKLTVMVPVVLEDSDNIRVQPSTLIQSLNEVEVECFPADLPAEAVVNVSEMQIGDVLTVADLDIAKNSKVEILTAKEEPVASLVEPKEEVIEEETTEASEVPTVSETEKESEDAE